MRQLFNLINLKKIKPMKKLVLIIVIALIVGVVIHYKVSPAASQYIGYLELIISSVCSIIFFSEWMFKLTRKKEPNEVVQISKVGGALFIIFIFLFSSFLAGVFLT